MRSKLNSLQALRGIAALLVVLFHYRGFLNDGAKGNPTIWDKVFSPGIIGVDIFFIISGFIMVYTTWNYMRGKASLVRFLLNRVIRIIPLYYLCLVIAFLLEGAMSTFHYPDKVQNILSALTFTLYKTSTPPLYIDDGGTYNIRWTLNYEIYFYLVFALCLLVKHRVLALVTWGILVTSIIPVIAGYQPAINVQGDPFSSPYFGFLTNPLLLEFIIGVIVGWLYIKIKQNSPSRKIDLLSGISAIVLLVYIVWGIYTGNIHALDRKSSLVLGLFVLALTLGESFLLALIPRFLTYVGNISFSLYLLHSAVGLAVVKRVGAIGDSAFKMMPSVLLAVGVSILAAHFTHKYIEINLTQKIKNKLKQKNLLKNPLPHGSPQ
ncbi:acyltransferase [Salmonella enterica subsp. diarizonae]|uniref:acyltransferase family protein n=1 Tax=Salmonella enterica TaxID=28901 RepID=UPI0009B00FA2|nr:acyltransferase [Salmonella enterica]EAW1825436.1 acyltransferase [Salmonella enterica subsp. diarizonae]EDT6984524.1 acyltransferase [Salmonella enterica subsp. arizonae]EBP1018025.1 acyltransferase [Salmonella enterica]ECE0306070.1 acyltransferase [Salmonella enterica subsp. diarizonae]ECO1373521.1 acyltransferase [Salmonella enterica subsp. diarizonae]